MHVGHTPKIPSGTVQPLWYNHRIRLIGRVTKHVNAAFIIIIAPIHPRLEIYRILTSSAMWHTVHWGENALQVIYQIIPRN